MKAFPLLLVTVILVAGGCDSNSGTEPQGTRTLFLKLTDLPAQPNDYHYEGWVHIDGVDHSFGKFSVDDRGRPETLSGDHVPAGQFDSSVVLDSAVYAYLTIEPPNGDDGEPSTTRLMGGLFADRTAELLVTNYEGLEDGLILSAGTYILATPTDGPNTNETSGVWFINKTAGDNGRGLRVPTPLEGWRYQGWIIAEGDVLTTGALTHHTGDDLASPYSGSGPTLGFPGEDFLFNAPAGLIFPLSLPSAEILVSVEPEPDPDPDVMSSLVLLRGRIPGEARTDSTYFLEPTWTNFPSARITLGTAPQ